jgi:hypothetical protein
VVTWQLAAALRGVERRARCMGAVVDHQIGSAVRGGTHGGGAR